MDITEQAEQVLLKKKIADMPIEELAALFPGLVKALGGIFSTEDTKKSE